MKYILAILFLFTVAAISMSSKPLPHRKWAAINSAFRRPFFFGTPHAATNKWNIGPGEYVSFWINTTLHRMYNPDGSAVSGAPDSFAMVAGGAHHELALTIGGNVWAFGQNGDGQCGQGNTTDLSSFTRITIDSLGNAFSNVKKIGCGGYHGWNSFAVKTDGTLWRWGDCGGGNGGNGTVGNAQAKRPVQVPFPVGTFIVDALCSDIGVALDSAGNVWTWGGWQENGGFFDPYVLAQGTSNPNRFSPTKLTWPTARVKQICGGMGNFNSILQTDGKVYAWGPYLSYNCLSAGQDMSTIGYVGWRIDTALTRFLPAGYTIDTMAQNNMMTAIILADSTAWMWGSNACSNLGLGAGLNMRHYTGTGGYAPYAWDQGVNEAMVYQPTQVMVGKHNFTKIFASTSLNFWMTLEDANDSVFVAGRDKGNVTGNMVAGIDSVAGDLQAQYPNSWDIIYWTYINPFNKPYTVRTTTPLFIDTSGAILQSTYPLNTSGSPPTCSAGSNQFIAKSYTTLNGSWGTTSPGKGLYSRHWVCTSKPSGAPNPIMPLVANDTVAVSGLQTGSYVFSFTILDNNFKTNTASVTITFNSAIIPGGIFSINGNRVRISKVQ